MNRDALGAGLCADCRHSRRVESKRGSVFLLCGRGADDPRFARYPPLPVLRCPGHEAARPNRSDPTDV